MKTSVYLLLLITLSLVSCTNEDMPNVGTSKTHDKFTYRITPQEAVDNASQYMHGLSFETRAGSRTVASVRAIGKSGLRTRSGITADTLLYIVNYKDSAGFAVVAADKRALPLYAIADSGNLEINNETPEPVIAMVNSAKRDAITRIGVDTFFIECNPYPWLGWNGWDEDIEYKIGPLLSPYQARLHHNLPFSRFCTTPDGKPASTGCLMASIEQILSYHEWPLSVDGFRLRWRMMNTGYDNDGIAMLLYILGQPEYLSATYKPSGPASASPSYIARTIQALGYEAPGSFMNIKTSSDVAIEALRNKGPLAMKAYKRYADGSSSGHSWVVDGVIRYKVKRKFDPSISVGGPTVPTVIYNYYNLFHCVWNFGGNCNGYYFQEFEGTPDFYDSTDDGTTDQHWNITYDDPISFIPGFTPIK